MELWLVASRTLIIIFISLFQLGASRISLDEVEFHCEAISLDEVEFHCAVRRSSVIASQLVGVAIRGGEYFFVQAKPTTALLNNNFKSLFQLAEGKYHSRLLKQNSGF